MRLDLVQPSLRREWELRRGAEVAARLRITTFRRRGSAELADRSLEIAREGGMRSALVVRDTASQEPLARLRRVGKRRLLEIGDRTAEWKRLGRKEGHGFVDPEGQKLLRARISSGFLHTNGEVEAVEELPEQDAVVLALLASYLLIRKTDDDASAAAVASTTAATS
jgi:hypothetical protein